MLIWLVAAALGAMLLFPQTTTGRALRRLLVEAPAAALNRLRRGHLALVALVGVMLAIALAMGREGFIVAGQVPEAIAWFAAFDIATYVDVIALGLIVATAVRLKSAVAFARAALGVLRRRRSGGMRRIRTALKRRAPPADLEGEPWPAALAAA